MTLTSVWLLVAVCLLAVVCSTAAAAAPLSHSFMLWDWSATAQDYDALTTRVGQCREAGFDTIDLTVAWKQMEPQRGEFDFTEIERRVEHIRSQGMRVRLRLNVSYAHAWPDWYPAVLMTGPGGATPTDVLSPFSPRAADCWSAAAEALAEHFRDRVDCYMPGFGMHMEIKYGDWISYEEPAVRSFRVWLQTRYGDVNSLNAAWSSGWASFAEVQPPVPPRGLRDAPQSVIDFIQFREDQLAYVTERFVAGFRRGYPQARVAVQLGESFRKESSSMSNLAYHRYSEHADEIVHSYDFFVHPPDAPHHAFESVRTFSGTTGKPVVVEFDGPILTGSYGYTDAHLAAIALACLDAGAAGIHLSNYCNSDPRPLPFVRSIAGMVSERSPALQEADALFYVSKWTFYCLTDDGSAHERVFGLYRKLLADGEKLRIITDGNLSEPGLGRYRKLYVGWSPVMSRPAYESLRRLMQSIPSETDERPGRRIVDAR